MAKKWGKYRLADVRTIAVEKWLRKLDLARESKAKIRSIMSVLFNHAIRHEFLPQGGNPITMVRQSAKRMRAPDILEVSELIDLFDQLAHRDRAMVLLDVVTGLRRSELIGLKWLDVNFEELELSVTRSVYRQRVGRCKTEISRKPVPLDPGWRRNCSPGSVLLLITSRRTGSSPAHGSEVSNRTVQTLC